ncbi:MAG: hypothetical protein JXA49_01885 [Actinobacteria bacterium]|nr:hypothetical protein [Actinomycetota bacterium]
MDIPLCKECGVPLHLSRNLCWCDNGVISLRGNPEKRWVFLESENIDNLFSEMEDLIGIPIGNLIIESRRKGARKYLEEIIPEELRVYSGNEARAGSDGEFLVEADDKKKFISLAKSITLDIYDVARVYGFGDSRLDPAWDRGDVFPWRNTVVRKPYSLLMNLAESLGQCEAMEGRDLWIEYEITGNDRFVYHCFESRHPVSLEGRHKKEQYILTAGDIEYERCPQCGMPSEVGKYEWNLDDGTIIDSSRERRMAVYGPYAFDSILRDLEHELGDEVPNLVIEAQRRYIKESWGNENWRIPGFEFRQRVAVRGLGNIVRFDPTVSEHKLLIENPCMHLVMVGIVQALVELARGWDASFSSYELRGDGSLEITIRRKTGNSPE